MSHDDKIMRATSFYIAGRPNTAYYNISQQKLKLKRFVLSFIKL